MTREEAIQMFEPYLGNDCYTLEFQTACSMAIDALREQARPEASNQQVTEPLRRNGFSGSEDVAASKNQVKTGWISVEDRLPKEQDSGLLVVVSGKPRKNITLERAIQIAYYYKADGWVIELFPEWENPNVTHWMPLPEPPEEEV